MQSITFKVKCGCHILRLKVLKAELFIPTTKAKDLWFYWISHPKKIFTLGGNDAFLTIKAKHSIFMRNIANKNVLFP